MVKRTHASRGESLAGRCDSGICSIPTSQLEGWIGASLLLSANLGSFCPMVGQIEFKEQVARKKWGGNIGQFPGVPDGLQPRRQKDPITLILELHLGAEFAVGEGIDRIPSAALVRAMLN
jgi:hypothetical protein